MQEDRELIDLGDVTSATLGIPIGWYEDIVSETHMD